MLVTCQKCRGPIDTDRERSCPACFPDPATPAPAPDPHGHRGMKGYWEPGVGPCMCAVCKEERVGWPHSAHQPPAPATCPKCGGSSVVWHEPTGRYVCYTFGCSNSPAPRPPDGADPLAGMTVRELADKYADYSNPLAAYSLCGQREVLAELSRRCDAARPGATGEVAPEVREALGRCNFLDLPPGNQDLENLSVEAIHDLWTLAAAFAAAYPAPETTDGR